MTPDSLSDTMIKMTKEMNGPARASYMRSQRIPLPMNENNKILGPDDFCFVTGKPIADDDRNARFTFKFDAWVSTEGQRVIEETVSARPTASMMTPSARRAYNEFYQIHSEWYAADAEPTPQEVEEADACNEEHRGWHK